MMPQSTVSSLICLAVLATAVWPSSAASPMLMKGGFGSRLGGGQREGGAPLLKRSPLELSGAAAKMAELGDAAKSRARALGGRVELVAKAAATKVPKIDYSKYPKLFAAGGLCASLTHWVTVPLDVVKTRSQVNPGEFASLNEGIRKIYAAEGLSGIMRGQVPTCVGFLLQGSLKFGFYEFFKDTLARKSIERDAAAGKKAPKPSDGPPQLPLLEMMSSAVMAEVIGTAALLPFETTRIRMVADPSFGKGTIEVMTKIVRNQGLNGIYGGVIPILCKQIPYTIAQFLVFEQAATVLYTELGKRDFDTSQGNVKTAITLGAALVAGTTASLISQPGDTLLSVMTKNQIGLMPALKQLGPVGLYRGASARMVHVSSYVVGQFLIYDQIKMLCGIPVAGQQAGKKLNKKK